MHIPNPVKYLTQHIPFPSITVPSRIKNIPYMAKQQNFILTAGINFIILLVVLAIWPNLIPIGLWDFWEVKGSVSEAVIGAWPIYLWGIGVTSLLAFSSSNTWRENQDAEKNFATGFIISFLAGTLEEIAFRWIYFLVALLMIPFVNWLLLGFMGIDIIQWLYSLAVWVANIFTFGILDEQLTDPTPWVIGAAIISANGDFRDGHIYLGPIGVVNSWFLGMYFFFIVFNYGLVAAMIIHFLYDLFIFTVIYIDAVIERARGG